MCAHVLRFCKLHCNSQSIHLPDRDCHVKNIMGSVPMMRASWGATRNPPSPIGSVMNEAASDRPPIRGLTQATAAASMSSTCGCGATAGGRSARSRCCRPWGRGRSAFASRRRGQAKQSSDDCWLLGRAALQMRHRDSRSRMRRRERCSQRRCVCIPSRHGRSSDVNIYSSSAGSRPLQLGGLFSRLFLRLFLCLPLTALGK